MKVLLLEVPSRERNASPPYGILYAGGAILRCGHEAKIIDYSNERFSFEGLRKEIKDYRPNTIGFGGITSSYRNLKHYALFLKDHFPHIPIIAGGVVSCIDELLLKKAKVDIVVRCEGEIAIPPILRYYQDEEEIGNIPGISYLKNGEVIRNECNMQVSVLDEIPFPPYELLDIKKYLYPAKDWVEIYFRYDSKEKNLVTKRLKNSPYMLSIMTSRGCTHRCIFCYRHIKGIRQHSVPYVIELIKYLKNKYGIGFFQFCDELTTASKKWVFDFCDALQRQQLDINFIILSARADNVDLDMLKRLKETGCLMLNYGYESGSDAILKEIGKGVNRQQNIRACELTKRAGIMNIPEIMIGFPGENDDTISDTVSFLKIADRYPVSVNFVLPFPKTPLWQYCVDKGLIRDEESFILNYGEAGNFQINLTKFPDTTVKNWWVRIMYETTRQACIKNRDFLKLMKIELWRKVRNKRIWNTITFVRNKLSALSIN